MAAVRRYVFPLIWMLIFAIIAIALARLAFFPGDAQAGDGEDPAVPAVEFDQYATVPVETGDIASALALPGVVESDPGTDLKATEEGKINKIWSREGDTVEKGQRILQVRIPQDPEPVLPGTRSGGEDTIDEGTGTDGTGDDGTGNEGTSDESAQAGGKAGGADEATPGTAGDTIEQPSPQAATEYTYVDLVASASGKLTGLAVEEWQSLAVGDVVASISPGTYSIVADLTPEQQLSLLDTTIKATATLPTSPDPVTCDAPDITEQSGSSDDDAAKDTEPQIDPMTGEETSSGTSVAQLECPVPEGTRIVPGLSVEVAVDLGTAEGVLVVPTTAVEGEGEAGTAYALDEETGEPLPAEVSLGKRGDGVVEITKGLEEGQEILQFVPGVDNPEDEMGMDGMGGW